MPSARETAAARERKAWKADFEEKKRTREDYVEYEKYVTGMRSNGLEPLDFFEWQKLVPEEFKNESPELRGAAASARSTWKQAVMLNRETLQKYKLDDKTLCGLGFSIRWRPNYEFEPLTQAIVTDLFTRFQQNESRFVPKVHLVPIGEFLTRNQLALVGPNIQTAFELLLSHGIISLPEPDAEPVRPEGINEHGVNLTIEKDPNVEAALRKQEYGTKIVSVGPDGTEYTQFALDRLPADQYKVVMGMVGNRLPRFSNVIGTSDGERT